MQQDKDNTDNYIKWELYERDHYFSDRIEL